MTRTGTLALLALAWAPCAFAQVVEKSRQDAPQTASAECRRVAVEYQTKALNDLRAVGKPVTAAVVNPVVAQSRRMAHDCADRIPLDNASVAELQSLAAVYAFSADTAKSRIVLEMVFNRHDLSEMDRANALLAAEALAVSSFDPFNGFNTSAELYLRELDALSDSVIAIKVRGHSALLDRYDYADYDAGIKDQATKLLELGRRALQASSLGMTPPRPGVPPYNAAYPVLTEAYGSLARVAGDMLHADSALLVIDEADRVVGPAYPPERTELDAARAMYRLVGAKATPIDGKWWINEKNGAKLAPGNGKVTLIQFTAHWCVPCRHSYPGMLGMTKHFAGKPYESIMETYLYGFIGDRQKLSPEEEVTADREYYTKHNALPFKIAINSAPIQGDTLTNDNERRYAVGGIPEIVIVDKKGIIRATVVGWDNGNEARLTALVEKLLAEK